MQAELQQRFYDRWPAWFAGRTEGMQHNLMCFGFDHGDGWFDLEWKLCEDLEKILGSQSPKYKLFQIKEKFGGLRWYDEQYGDTGEALSVEVAEKVCERVNQAENESMHVCEFCGKPGKLRTNRSWIQVKCDECEAKR